jgi:hypothetical protein
MAVLNNDLDSTSTLSWECVVLEECKCAVDVRDCCFIKMFQMVQTSGATLFYTN